MILRKSFFFALFLVGIIGFEESLLANNPHQFIKNQTILQADSLFLFRDDYEGSKKLFLQALREVDQKEWGSKAYCHIMLSNIYTSLEDYDQAEKRLTKARELINDHLDDKSPVTAEFHCYLGKYLLRKNLYDSAGLHLDKSIELKRKLLGEENIRLAESLFFKAELYSRGYYLQSKSEKLYRDVISIYNSVFRRENVFHAKVYSSLASCLRQQFDFSNAIEYGKRSLQLFRSYSVLNPNRITSATLILANIYTDIGDYESSLPLYQDILNNLDKTDNEFLYSWYAYTHLAQCYYNLGQFDIAKKHLDQYLDIIITQNLDVSLLAFQYILYGDFYLEYNDLKKAREYLFEAKDYYENELTYEKNDATICYEKIGDLYVNYKKYDSALYYYQNAIIKLVDDFEEQNIFVNPVLSENPEERKLYDIFYKKAAAFKKRFEKETDINYLKAGLDIYMLIDELNDKTRNSKLKDASLLLLNNYYREEYENAIETAYLLHNKTGETTYLKEAFHFMEKSKYMLVFEALTLAEKNKSLDFPDSIKSLEDSLRMVNEQFHTLLEQERQSDNPDEMKVNTYEEYIFRTEKALDDLRIKISEKFPEYYDIKYDSLTKGIDDFVKHCRQNNVSGIEYFWGNENIYAIFSDGNKICFNKVLRTDTLNRSIISFLGELSNGVVFEDISYKKFAVNAHFIFNNLLKETLQLPENETPNLLIITDGILAQLPFEALLTSSADTAYTDYSSLPYLIKSVNIQYAYSANLLLNKRKTNKEPGQDLLAFSYSNISALTDDGLRSSGNELPRSAVELTTIKNVMKGDNRFYYDSDATEHQFKEAARDYRIIHLAVHGYADTLSGQNSKLVFKNDRDTVEDGTLYMHELYGMDLTGANLAVLSACETGIGREYIGEGMFSMARGFAYAGCPSIVMSLWKVSDDYTSDLMKDFYLNLKRGKTTKEALRNAKLSFIEQHGEYEAHPANWASFVLVGNDDQLFEKKNYLFYVLLGLIIFITSGLFYFWKSKIST